MLEKLGRTGLVAFAWLFAALGMAGLFLPLVPGVLFLIVAALLAARASPDLMRRIYAIPKAGPDVEAFVTRGVMRRAAKRSALIGIAIGALAVGLVVGPASGPGMVALAGMAVGAAYVATRPSADDAG
jgi:uncharacterized membrane protein YbaN (DUF454 family)